jgi:AcrR family transcriptional regulator
MVPQATPQPDRAEERRQQIMEAALACFARKGYHKTTMDDIVAESGLSKGTLYWYFKSKDDLFVSLVKSFFLDMRQDSDAILAQHETASGKLRAIAQYFVKFFQEMEPFFSVFFEFWMQSALSQEINHWFSELLGQYQTVIAGVVQEGVTTGEFKASDSRDLALAFMAVFDGLFFYAMLMPEAVDIERSSHAFIETLLTGLLASQEGIE